MRVEGRKEVHRRQVHRKQVHRRQVHLGGKGKLKEVRVSKECTDR